MIPFKQIPANIRVPLFYAEVDNSQANTGQTTSRALILAQMTSQGTATPNVPAITQGQSDAIAAGGQGSMLAAMVEAYQRNDSFGELWYVPLADSPTATAASGSVSITTAPTAAGTLYLYIAGVRIAQPVAPTQTVAQIATALAATIAATPGLPVSAAAAAGIVTLTALNKGPCGNGIDLRLNYYGTPAGEVLPPGLKVTIAPMTGGATAPDLTAALDALGDQTYDYIVCPYSDPISLDALKNFMDDINGRWSWQQMLYGHVFAAAAGTLGGLVAIGTARNDPHASIMGFNDSPTPAYLWAASLAGACAVSLRADPATPVQTLPLIGVLPPPVQSRFTLSERNSLLYDGIATFTVADDGTVAIENLITTYQKNAYGQPDDSYLEVETLYTLAALLRHLASVVTSRYGRVKLADDGTRFAAGSNIVTPNIIRADLIAAYQEDEYNGLVQDSSVFAKELIVERNATNPNRVDVLWPGILIDQLRIFALLAQFRLTAS
ncbi:phage tail sheath subtilisin-like domain-containing protein [Paraburkholderia mimosarum]|uniref:phage tail sheath subtilisin-like domain-containing protein n=1 Tax=Paraburkholderia mimosarum TaxID=312026 RepID=UPI00040A3859|nr:phage tail sheath subtilisin-like domain-containing protein [Paraburkholderia mimosarum]